MVVNYGIYDITILILVKPLLSNIFMEGKHFWIELEESNDIFQ